MLVRDSEALAQFRVDHRIPDDVVIERPGPNDDADWVEGEGNRMPIRTWFIYQAGLRFPLSKLLRTVLSICGLTFMQISLNFVRTVLAVEALMQREGLEFTTEDLFHVYCMVKSRKNPETQMLEGNHYLRLRKPNQPQTRLVTDSPDKDQHLNDFIWVSSQWEFPADEPDPFSVPRHRGYVPVGFNRCFWRRSDWCSAAISVVNNCGRSRRVSDLLGYVPLISDIDLGNEALNEEAEGEDGEEVDQVPATVPLVPAPLVLVPEPINLLSSDSNVAIIEPREIVEHSYSHSGSSSSGSQVNAEIMAPKVRILGKGQGPIVEPPTLPEAPVSSTPAPTKDQSIAPSLMGGKRKRKQPAKGTSRPKKGKGAGSAAGTPELWAPQFAAVELGKQVTSADTSKDHETCVALGNAVMLPQDVADHAAKTMAEFGGKLVMLGAKLFQWAVSSTLRLKQGTVDLKKANQKANSLEKELKQTKSELTDARSAAEIAILQQNHAKQEASDLKAFACGEAHKKLFDRAFERAGDVYERQLAELRPGVFQEGWFACLKELQIPLDHPAWLSPAPPVQLPASQERYSPINLPDFNEEEYATLPADEGNINTAVVEAHAGVAETADRDQVGEAEGDRAVEAEGENLV
ncbi:hypothetical protein Acr_25g0000240 [Actinidia rufa]|uniref:Uncharacterized protein n=1 Tax=Actinidia rufa TaxID=165716 RepID=A0A7J0GXR2_9ERIC|nr:hypothetical protein Acr_25g0000240 [Actinidia rufa]